MKTKASLKDSKPELSSKELVVDAYILLAYEIGIANITLQKIAEKAGVAFSTVRYYFSQDQFDIHHEAFNRVMAASLQNVGRGSKRLEKLSRLNPVHAYVGSMFDWISEDRVNSTYLIYAYYNASADLKTAVDLSYVNDSARKKVQSALLESIGLEVYKPVGDAAACASGIHACVVGHGFVAMTVKGRSAFKAFHEQCLITVDALIESARKR